MTLLFLVAPRARPSPSAPGTVPRRGFPALAPRRVEEWGALHTEDLLADWERRERHASR